eukprot:Hpha_TRINITY_DN3855_c0_g1::TRINITY_DN3855_c0_g1_i1::g.44570::m.44570
MARKRDWAKNSFLLLQEQEDDENQGNLGHIILSTFSSMGLEGAGHGMGYLLGQDFERRLVHMLAFHSGTGHGGKCTPSMVHLTTHIHSNGTRKVRVGACNHSVIQQSSIPPGHVLLHRA